MSWADRDEELGIGTVEMSRLVTPKGMGLVRESDPQNGRTIQFKDLFHKLPRNDGTWELEVFCCEFFLFFYKEALESQ